MFSCSNSDEKIPENILSENTFESILKEIQELSDKNFKEVTLLGQNVDSYRWNINKKGEKIDPNTSTTIFSELLEKVWGSDVYVVERTVDVHIRKLREKIPEYYIKTLKGVGYLFSIEKA